MEQSAEQEVPSRRISLTKTQRHSAEEAELLSLCQVVTTDGSLSDEEVSSLRARNLRQLSLLIRTLPYGD